MMVSSTPNLGREDDYQPVSIRGEKTLPPFVPKEHANRGLLLCSQCGVSLLYNIFTYSPAQRRGKKLGHTQRLGRGIRC